MILFFVGIIEMVISASYTKAVSKANVAMTGAITTVNIFIWYYVIRVVVDNLDNWLAIIPYTAGCAIGAMIGAVGPDILVKRSVRWLKKTAKRSIKKQPSAPLAEPLKTTD